MTFPTRLVWSGAARSTTRENAMFSRDLEVVFNGNTLPMSAAPQYRGDPTRANPEQLFVGSVSACQALTYLFLAGRSGVTVTGYEDDAVGEMQLVNGMMQMTDVTLRPRIFVAQHADLARARELVAKAHAVCFIANSVTTAVHIEPLISAEAENGSEHVDTHTREHTALDANSGGRADGNAAFGETGNR